jgi:uncharacterized protein YndB with AHSA1/START domain
MDTAALERQVTLPTDAEEAWGLLTRPEDAVGWLGAQVELRLEAGASGLVVDHDGTRRRLVVDEVEVGRRLAWHWAEEGADGDLGAVTRVEVTLTPEEDGTRLLVTERPLESTPVQASAGAAWSHRLLHLEALLLVAAAVRG